MWKVKYSRHHRSCPMKLTIPILMTLLTTFGAVLSSSLAFWLRRVTVAPASVVTFSSAWFLPFSVKAYAACVVRRFRITATFVTFVYRLCSIARAASLHNLMRNCIVCTFILYKPAAAYEQTRTACAQQILCARVRLRQEGFEKKLTVAAIYTCPLLLPYFALCATSKTLSYICANANSQ